MKTYPDYLSDKLRLSQNILNDVLNLNDYLKQNYR